MRPPVFPIIAIMAVCCSLTRTSWQVGSPPLSDIETSVGVLRNATNRPSSPVPMKPLLLLHVGPHKTGTSSLQCALTFLTGALREVASFNFLGMGYKSCLSKRKFNGTGRATAYPLKLKLTRSLIDCLNQHGSSGGHLCNQTETWIGFEALLKSISAQGQNAIRSDEAFSRMYHSDDNLCLLQSTLTRYFRVRVVVVYRRYHEWLLSLHNEIHKTVSRRPHFQLWPQNGGIPLESFRDFYRRVVKGVAWIDGKEGVDKEKNIWYLRAAEKENIHASKYLQRVFGQYFDDVVVFNMNQNGSLVSNFIEGMLPVAKEVINDLEKAPQKRYPSTVLDYDMLAVAAHDKGLLQRNSTRRDIRRAIAAVLPPNLTLILPRVCISPLEESAFLNRSMLFERQMFGEHSLDSRHDFETSFAKASRGLKFCNVDTEAVLTNRSLQEFFRSL